MEPDFHIRDWGIDADPENEPTYPMKHYTGDDRKRSHWKRPSLQQASVEILKSTERPYLSAVFGTPLPPRGINGALKRFAYKYSENMYRHWLILLFSDRVDAVRGRFSDLFHGRIFRGFKDRGLGVLFKYKPALFFKKLFIRLILIAGIVLLIYFLSR